MRNAVKALPVFVFLLGLVAIVVGVYIIEPAAGLVAAGVIAVILAAAYVRGGDV